LAVNPKSGGLTIAAASIAADGLSGGGQAAAPTVFVLVGSLGVLVYLAVGQSAARTLDSWTTWAGDHPGQGHRSVRDAAACRRAGGPGSAGRPG
jgi:hypothetical protein